ncbi:MAG: AlpA family transcriptional regulator [Acidithiobacillus sp.]|nr:AlpA family transcriptional regulator [Acidithiobacillus sp.]
MPKKNEVTAAQEVLDRLPAVQARVNASKTSIYGWMKSGDFPQPVKLGPRAVAWRRSDVDAWIGSRTSHVA